MEFVFARSCSFLLCIGVICLALLHCITLAIASGGPVRLLVGMLVFWITVGHSRSLPRSPQSLAAPVQFVLIVGREFECTLGDGDLLLLGRVGP